MPKESHFDPVLGVVFGVAEEAERLVGREYGESGAVAIKWLLIFLRNEAATSELVVRHKHYKLFWL